MTPTRRRAAARTATARLTALAAALVALTPLTPVAEARTVTVFTTGHTVTLHRGDRLVVRLPESLASGYHWMTLAKPALLRTLSTAFVAAVAPTPGLVAEPGTRVYSYGVRGRGSGSLRLAYLAPDTGDATRRFTVNVRSR